MNPTRRLRGPVGLVLALGLFVPPLGRCAAPPIQGPPRLDPQQQRQITALRTQFLFAEARGQYEEGARVARQVLALCEKWQGQRHWQTINARLDVQRWQRLARVKAADRADLARAWRLDAHATQLQHVGRLRSSEAEKKIREALAIRSRVLGQDHPETAVTLDDLAHCLKDQGQHARALALFEKALAGRRKSLGEEHPDTATSCMNVATCLTAQGKHAQALALSEKALAINRQVLGEEHPDTARSYNHLAVCLVSQGQRARALPLFEKAYLVQRRAQGEEHRASAQACNNLAACLLDLGQAVQALRLHQRTLELRRTTLGDDHPDTAESYHHVAGCLNHLGRHAEALLLDEKALAICRQALGEEHPSTIRGYNSLAVCLHHQRKYTRALPLYEKALALCRKALGEEHPHTATTANNLALCLSALGRYAQAQPLYEKTLAAQRKVCGEEHPSTALTYNNLALCLGDQGQHAGALRLHRKALAIWRTVLGEEHPDTALGCNNLAGCLDDLGRLPEAVHLLQASLPGQEAARFHAAPSGFDRALAARRTSPHRLLAEGLARLKQPGNAFRHAEASLARGLLDDLARSDPAGARRIEALSARLRVLDASFVSLFGRGALSAEQQRLREELARQRRSLSAELARLAGEFSARQVAPLSDIQSALPADAALVFWLDRRGRQRHWACVVRRQGAPAWVELPGTGKAGAWTEADLSLGNRLFTALLGPTTGAEQRTRLAAELRRQRLAPLREHLGAVGQLPAVTRLFVVPQGWAAFVPVELLVPEYRVSYVPSGSVLARLRRTHRPLSGTSLLALGDPAFETAPARLPEPPAAGVMLKAVLPGGNAARAGLQPGDVLLSIGTQPVNSPADLAKALASAPARAVYWREGKQLGTRLSAGQVGAVIDKRSARAAVRAWRRQQRGLAQRGTGHGRLPGTRLEVESIARLVPSATILLGSDASEQELDRLGERRQLRRYRLLHFATHGEISSQAPDHSRLILAQDRLPRPGAARKGYTGALTVQTIRRNWALDCDLVVLSACQTALGQDAGGEGLLGFAQAFLSRGARSVVLSRWKVDDTATALLMVRFYENLLGKRAGLKKGMGRAAALAEAKSWLRQLPRKQAGELAARLGGGVLRGTEGEALPLVKGKGAKLPGGEKPFAHPYYWAAFVLVGDPS